MLDTGNNLVLSVETDRVINLNSSRYFLGVEGDKEVKIIRFQLDRYYCGIDLSVFKPRVNYKLSNSKEYYGDATIADFDEDYIYVEWTLDPSVTSVKGRVDFLVQLTKLDEDGSILKRYNSTMAMGMVEEGLNPEDQLPESMKKDILAIAEDALTQLKESKTEFDNRLKNISDKQNKIIVRLDATDLKINNFDENYETKMNDFHANYQEKMETFETDYSEKMKSAIKNIEDTSVQSVTNVENAKDEALQNIQNKSTEFLNNIDKLVNDIQPYSDSYIEKWFNLMRTGRVYTVKFPLWETSQSPIGEKLDANRGLICEPSTPVYAGQNDYDEIPVFKTFDVNAYVDNDGEVHLTAFKGDENFQDTGKVDVFVLTMSYYEKTWTEDGYWYYSISDSPKPGYTIAKECLKKDGSIRPYALYAKYVAGAIDGQPYSSKGLIPCYYPFETISAYHMVSYCKQRGKYYTGGLMWDYKYIWTRFMLKFANTNSQAVLGGVFDYPFQYPVTIAEENVKRVIVSKSNAARYVVGSCVSIGDLGDATSMDRSNKNCHNIARNVKILTIEDIDDSNSALNLDLAEPITTTTTCRVTTMHYLSGYSDEILGRDGSLGTDPKSTKHPIVISGIECAVGGYEIPCNAMMNILNASGDREVYITHDATKLSTNTQTIMNTWKKSGMTIKTSKVNNWQYITKMGIDTELGCVLPLAAGESGSGSSTGFGDGLYCDNAATGQREFLLLGHLWYGSIGGLSCLHAYGGFSDTGWYCLARISIMAVRGE